MNLNSKIKNTLTYLFFIVALNLFAQNNLLPDTTAFCIGDSAIIELKQNFEGSINTEWRGKSLGIIYNSKKIKIKSPLEKIYLKVNTGKAVYFDSTVVKIYPKPKLNLRDTSLCNVKSFILDAKNSGSRFEWSTNEKSQKIKIDNSGTYWVKVSNLGCSSIDTIKVKFFPGASIGFNNEVVYCLSEQNKLLTVKVNLGSKILWNTGSTAPSIVITNEGLYWVKTENKNCGEQVDSVRVKLKVCDCEMMVPNSFTPNDDNRNDYFYPVLQCDYSYYKLIVTDKYDNTVFTGNSINAKWDGRYKGNLCPEELYIYRIESIEKGSDKKVLRSGKVSLIR